MGASEVEGTYKPPFRTDLTKQPVDLVCKLYEKTVENTIPQAITETDLGLQILKKQIKDAGLAIELVAGFTGQIDDIRNCLAHIRRLALNTQKIDPNSAIINPKLRPADVPVDLMNPGLHPNDIFYLGDDIPPEIQPEDC